MTLPAAHPSAVHPSGEPHSAAARWVLAVLLVLGVLGMHALMGPTATTPGAGTTDASTSMAVAVDNGGASGVAHAGQRVTPTGNTALATYVSPGDTSPVGGHAPAGGHSMLTMCLAVLGSLSALVLLIAAVLARHRVLAESPAGWRHGTARFLLGQPPPWTVPSLHQLSLLRV